VQAAAEAGKDYDRERFLKMDVAAAEQLARKLKKKENTEWTTFEDAAERKYDRLVGRLRADTDAAATQKAELGSAFYSPVEEW
jgi:hypothetical protein